jgi:CubicO group peptidase (beta-lactamase class C family)
VTIRHLLSHTSGLANPLPLKWIHSAAEAGPDLAQWTRELFEEHRQLNSNPGEKYAYSNLGYLILGLLIQEVSGVPFERYVSENILAPLEMHTTGFLHTPSTAAGHTVRLSPIGLVEPFLVEKWARYKTTDGYAELKPFLVDGAPYGGLVGTAEDMVNFGLAFLGDKRFPLVLEASRVQQAVNAQQNSVGKPIPMGLGWHLDEVDGVPYAYHLGGGAGYKSELRIYPTLGYAVAVAANESSFATEQITSLILQP